MIVKRDKSTYTVELDKNVKAGDIIIIDLDKLTATIKCNDGILQEVITCNDCIYETLINNETILTFKCDGCKDHDFKQNVNAMMILDFRIYDGMKVLYVTMSEGLFRIYYEDKSVAIITQSILQDVVDAHQIKSKQDESE